MANIEGLPVTNRMHPLHQKFLPNFYNWAPMETSMERTVALSGQHNLGDILLKHIKDPQLGAVLSDPEHTEIFFTEMMGYVLDQVQFGVNNGWVQGLTMNPNTLKWLTLVLFHMTVQHPVTEQTIRQNRIYQAIQAAGQNEFFNDFTVQYLNQQPHRSAANTIQNYLVSNNTKQPLRDADNRLLHHTSQQFDADDVALLGQALPPQDVYVEGQLYQVYQLNLQQQMKLIWHHVKGMGENVKQEALKSFMTSVSEMINPKHVNNSGNPLYNQHPVFNANKEGYSYACNMGVVERVMTSLVGFVPEHRNVLIIIEYIFDKFAKKLYGFFAQNFQPLPSLESAQGDWRAALQGNIESIPGFNNPAFAEEVSTMLNTQMRALIENAHLDNGIPEVNPQLNGLVAQLKAVINEAVDDLTHFALMDHDTAIYHIKRQFLVMNGYEFTDQAALDNLGFIKTDNQFDVSHELCDTAGKNLISQIFERAIMSNDPWQIENNAHITPQQRLDRIGSIVRGSGEYFENRAANKNTRFKQLNVIFQQVTGFNQDQINELWKLVAYSNDEPHNINVDLALQLSFAYLSESREKQTFAGLALGVLIGNPTPEILYDAAAHEPIGQVEVTI